MEKTYTIQSLKNRPDASKGQKIVAALYLLTNHISDNDPLKLALRTHAIQLVQGGDPEVHADQIAMLLGASVTAQIMSEKNVAIVVQELALFVGLTDGLAEQKVSTLFDDGHKHVSVNKRTEEMSFIGSSTPTKTRKQGDISSAKDMRQSQILSFINDRKSVSIKDISALFTDVSEKTIQRELGTLVTDGKITKRGSKRWSIYMALPAA